MASVRIFLGWDRPLCESVPAHLLAGAGAGLHDLRGVVVVTPTRQSSWRLRGALPVVADARGAILLGAEIVNPAVLLAPPPRGDTATALQCLLAWCEALKSVSPGEFSAFLGVRSEGRTASPAWALQVARRLGELRQELADGGYAITDVAALGAEIEERDRWVAMAELEGRYLAQLTRWGLQDGLTLKLANARLGVLPPNVSRVVVAAVPDPPRLLLTLLDRWAAGGGAVEYLVAAPESEAPAFDAWGRPLPEVWQSREIVLKPEDLWLEATPDAQAARVAGAICDGMAGVPAPDKALRPQVAIGVPDRETVAPLLRELAALELPAFDPQNRRFAESPLFALVQGLLALRRSDGYAETAALLRHPDVLAAIEGGATVLRELDAFQSEYLPVSLEDMLDRLTAVVPDRLRVALVALHRWRAALSGPGLAAALRAVLREIYKQRLLKSDNPEDAAFQQAVTAFDEIVRELERAAAAGQGTGDAGDTATDALLVRLQETSIKPERGTERLDLEGWLELAWNPAPLLFVAGMNEGAVPDSQVGDLFLPDTLRRRLSLRDDHLRVARDAYVLTALLAQRQAAGRVILLLGKTSLASDPLRPSRLLFRCPDEALVARARLLFRDPPAGPGASAFTFSFKLDPARLPSGALDPKRSRVLSPTLFSGYLACPLRFYLRQVLGMAALDDRSREPDAMAFGTLVHAVLQTMGEAPAVWACGDDDHLGDWLEDHLRDVFRKRYGRQPWLGVELALDSAVRRLRAFATEQVAWHAQGWDIHERPEQKRKCTIGGLELRGRIDRIDRNRHTGQFCVLDYKTSDKAKSPEAVHLGPVRDPETLDAAFIPAAIFAAAQNRADDDEENSRKKPARDKRWADLQLPLYRLMVAEDLGDDVATGYICLPDAVGDTAFKLWKNYSPELQASAMDCAEAVVSRIRDGVFWPPGPSSKFRDDELAGVLLEPIEACLVPPANPWGGAT